MDDLKSRNKIPWNADFFCCSCLFFLFYRLFSLVLFKQILRHEIFFPWSFCKSKFASIPCFLAGYLTNQNRNAKGSPLTVYQLSELIQDSGNVSLFNVLWHLNIKSKGKLLPQERQKGSSESGENYTKS